MGKTTRNYFFCVISYMDDNIFLLFIYCIYFVLVLELLWFIQKREFVIFNFWVPILSCFRAVATMNYYSLYYKGLQLTNM